MTYTVGVRALCEFTARSGDLDLRFSAAPTAQQGREGHASVTTRRRATYQTEVALEGRYGADLVVRGRADGFDAQKRRVEEIKTFRGAFDSIRANQQATHWAQARIYAHLLCEKLGLQELTIALVYYDV